MVQLSLSTAASRYLAQSLAQDIAERHPKYYGAVPGSFLMLSIREILRFCEDNNIWEPANLRMIVRAMFAPAPSWLSEADRDYAINIICNTAAAPEARARSVSQALTGIAPPPREPSGLR